MHKQDRRLKNEFTRKWCPKLLGGHCPCLKESVNKEAVKLTNFSWKNDHIIKIITH